MSASLRIAAASQNDPEQNPVHVRSYPVQADGDWPCCRSTAVNTCVSWDGSSLWVRTGAHWLDGHSPTAPGNVVTARAKSESSSHKKCVSTVAENGCGTRMGTARTIPKAVAIAIDAKSGHGGKSSD